MLGARSLVFAWMGLTWIRLPLSTFEVNLFRIDEMRTRILMNRATTERTTDKKKNTMQLQDRSAQSLRTREMLDIRLALDFNTMSRMHARGCNARLHRVVFDVA